MTTDTVPEEKSKLHEQAAVTTGPAAAALVSSSEGLRNALNWWNPAGPLTGKTGVGVILWLVSWFVLNSLWKDKDSDLNKAFTVTLVLIGLGLILTFPPVFEAFE